MTAYPSRPVCRHRVTQQSGMLAYQHNAQRYAQNQGDDDPPTATDTSLFIEESYNYLTRTTLSNGKVGMIVDPGSVWDLSGSQRAGAVA